MSGYCRRRQSSVEHTGSGPEALGRLDEDILEQSGESIPNELRPKECKDRDAGILEVGLSVNSQRL